MLKKCQKSNVIDNDVIMLRPIMFCQKMSKSPPCISIINGRIIMKFCTAIVHEKPNPHTKQNLKISHHVM